MAKSIKAVKKPKSKKSTKAEAIDWAEPFPPPDETKLVRVQVTQELRVSPTRLYPVGVHIMDAATAHAHSGALTTPPPLTEE